MFHWLLKPVLALTILLALTVVVIRATPDDTVLSSFITGPDNCSGNCLLGLLPGKTTVSEALDQLGQHPWVTATHMAANGQGYGQIRWEWSGQQPGFIDDSYLGRITFYWDDEAPSAPTLSDTVIQTIAITTLVPMDRFVKWYGQPDFGTAAFRPDMELGYSAAYSISAATLMLTTILPCPVNLLTYWQAPTKIMLSIGHGTSVYVPPAQMTRAC